MDKINKLLKRLNAKERAAVLQAVTDISAKRLQGYDVKKMRGHANVFRVRVGQIRIVYMNTGEDARILMIDRRHDNTYRDF